MGDDMQLPAVVTNKNNYQSFGAAQTFERNGLVSERINCRFAIKGANIFKLLAENVMSLRRNFRIQNGESKLQEFCTTLRQRKALSLNQAKSFLQYKLITDFPSLCHSMSQFI